MAKTWRSSLVEEMLRRAMIDAAAFRPETLSGEFGLSNQGYRLSDAQAQAILDLRLQRLTGLEQEKLSPSTRKYWIKFRIFSIYWQIQSVLLPSLSRN